MMDHLTSQHSVVPAGNLGFEVPDGRPLGPYLERIGGTPLVPLTRLGAGLAPGVEVLVKMEGLNPGGSVKDRAALSMVLEAERAGLLRPGMRIIDASSGNTGIAYAMVAAARGYRLTLCLPANANLERKRTLLAYGVDIVLTDPLAGTDGAIERARAMVAESPEQYVYLNQYNNSANWMAHLRTTGPEIWAQTAGRITHFVAGLGTTGTFVGTSRFLKQQNPNIVCAALQPDGPFHALEGLKHLETAMVPGIWDPSLVDRELAAPSEPSLVIMRRLAAEEGLFVGPSSGAAVWGALEVARAVEAGVVVAVLPDGGGRYLSEAHLFESRRPEDPECPR